ncbi:MAG: hypothetical protein R3Y26_05640 [Rikenellaceae bacterium]
MASIKRLKKDVDYLISEIISDSYTCLIMNSEIDQNAVLTIVEEAVNLRNSLFDRINNPAEKHNKSLVKKHYYLIRENMFEAVDGLFVRLSDLCTK